MNARPRSPALNGSSIWRADNTPEFRDGVSEIIVARTAAACGVQQLANTADKSVIVAGGDYDHNAL